MGLHLTCFLTPCSPASCVQMQVYTQIMLVIRTDQLRVLGDDRVRQFEEKMAAYVRTSFPALSGADDRRSRELVRESIEIARTFGLDQEYDLRRFIEFRAEYGENFHVLDWAAAILNDPTLSACGKMERIDDYSLNVLRVNSR